MKLPKYHNPDMEKNQILSENREKSGIYMWTNKINDKRYIGSSENLSNRLKFYYLNLAMKNYLKNSQSNIYNALLKYGHENFSLTIVEYCDKEKCIERENYYLKAFNPEYNISKEAGAPMSGRNHSDESKKIMSDNNKGENNPMFGQNHSDETRKKISEANKGKTRADGAGMPAQQIEVVDLQEKTITTYDSIREAVRALNIHKSVIDKYFSRNQEKPYKGRYTFKKI
jgi:group I intron endonuclease